MRKLLPVLFILISSVVSAQKPAVPSIDIRVINSKFQFVSKTSGQPVNTQLWDEVDPFVNGFARVFLNNKFSFVNDKGKLISPVNYEDARNFAGNLAVVKKDGKWGCINESGNIVLPFNYEILFDFDGTVTTAYSNRKWWLVNNKGAIITQLDISVCFGFKNGVAKITRDNKEGFLYPDGRIVLSQPKPVVNPAIPYHPNPNSNSAIAECPDNINFEYGDFTNWQCYIGQVDSIGTTNVITVNPSPPTPNRHTIISRVLPSAIDPYGLFPTNPPDGSNFAVKLGNTNVGAEAERITYAIHIPLNDSNFSIKYNYAVVFQDPGHTAWTQPRFMTQLRDSATGLFIDCASFEYISTSGLPGFEVSPVNAGVLYKSWSSVFYSLRGYAGKTIYLEFTNADCVRRAHWGYAYIDVESTCGSPVEVHYDCTYPNATTLTAPPGFQFYNWWDQTYSTLLGSGQQLNMNPGPAVNSIIWLEMIPFNNFGCKDTLMININGDFDAEFDMSADNGCAPQTFTFYNRNLPSTTTLWNFGDGTTGTGDTVTHTYSIPGTYRVTLDVTVPGGCNGTALHPITIYPTPNVVQPPNLTFCNGTVTTDINFTGSPSSTIFNWTNDNPSIGLPASGTGDILSFTAINTGNIAETAIITITPTHLTCPGMPKTFTITVNPSPDVVQPADQILCNNTVTNAVNFSGTLAGTSFSWTNNNTSIGLSASGNGNIPAFIATNTGNTQITATITVTPATTICPGTARSFTITVNPVPNVVQPVNQTLCNGTTAAVVTFTGSVSGTTFSWINNNTAIGLPASGNGNIPAFTGINPGSAPVTATIIVTPVANGCPGTPRSFTITIYPTPDVLQPVDQIVCNGASSNAINFSGSVTGTQFSWINNNTTIGLPASGNGNISAFMVTNSTNVPITASITVIPAAVGCLGTPKTFTITVKPTPDVNRPSDQTVCNAATTNAVNFNGSVAGTVFNWTNNNTTIGLAANGTGDIAPFTAIAYFNNVNTGTITVTPDAVGCAGTPEYFAINVNPTPDLVRPQDQAICSGLASNAIIFNSSVNGTVYNWTNTAPAIGLPASGTGNIASFVASSNGSSVAVATITVTPSAMGCPGLPKNFIITVNPIPSVAQPVDQTLCNGTSTNMVSFTGSLSNISTYSWTNNKPSIGLATSGTGDIAPFTAINNSNVPITATITVTPSANSCPGPAKTFTITINPPPAINAGNNQNVCLGNSTSLSATGAIQYLWSPATGLSCTTCPNPVVTPVDSVSYTVRGESNLGCFAFDTVLLTVSRPFQMLISPDDTLCIGESANLRASGANNYLWSPPQGLNRTDIADPTATPNATTLYRVVGYDGRNCFTDTSYVRLIVGPRPTVNIGADLTLSTGSVVTLNAVTQNGPIINWAWSPSTGLSCADCPNPTLTVRDNIYYELTVTNDYGCKATDIIAINTFCKSAQVFVPNAFTPDGDGLNDILMVRGKGIFVKTFRIFNRWGELIFERTNFNPNDPKFGWDGKIRGIPATPDVFVYTAEVVCDNDVMYTYKGNTTLLK